MKTNIELAREAGMMKAHAGWVDLDWQGLDRFSSLVEQRLIAKLTEGSGGAVVFYQDSTKRITGYTAEQLAAAVLAERERCAGICANVGAFHDTAQAGDLAFELAAAIRGATT